MTILVCSSSVCESLGSFRAEGRWLLFIPELMTVRDFTRTYRIGRTSFYREVNAGRLRIVKFGRSTRIARLDAEAWLASIRGR